MFAILENIHDSIPAEKDVVKNILISVMVIVLAVVSRFIARKTIINSKMKSEELKQKWLVQVRNLTFICCVFALMIIWGSELRTIALSLLAIAVAIVIATKELILCLTGSIYKATCGAFSVGDRITIGNYRGMVADQNLLSTTLFEISRETHKLTGKTLFIPNAMFLTESIHNENNSREYILHSFSITTKKLDQARELEKLLMTKLEDMSAPFIAAALKDIRKTFSGKDLDATTCHPKIIISQVDSETLKFNMRFPTPENRIGRSEQEIMQIYMDWLEKSRDPLIS